MKKILCPNCKELIEVNKEKVKINGMIECPKCNQYFNYNDAFKNSNKIYLNHVNKAYKLFYFEHNYIKAKEEYKSCLEYDPNYFPTICAYTLSDFYSKKTNEISFKEFKDTINKYDIELDKENSFTFLGFVFESIYLMEHYLRSVIKNYVENEIFITKDLFDLYLKNVNEMNDLLNFFEETFPLLDKDEYQNYLEENKLFVTNLKTMKDGINTRLNSVYKINNVGDIQIENGKVKEIIKKEYNLNLNKEIDYNLLTLNQDVSKITFILIALYVILAILMVVFFILYLTLKNNIFLYFMFLYVLLALIIYIVSRKKIKDITK